MNDLSIVIPCVRSAQTLPDFIDKLAIHLMNNPTEIDVIVVANENTAGASEALQYVRKKYSWLQVELLQRKGNTRRYGALSRLGIAYSASKYVVLVSPYGEDDVSIIEPMLKEMRQGCQVVQAISEHSVADSSIKQVKFNLYRRLYRIFAGWMLGVEFKSATSTFKMFDRVFVQCLGLNQNGYSLCSEITNKVILAGGKIGYVNSSCKYKPVIKDFKLYREGFGYLWLLIRGMFHRIGILWF